MTPDRPLRRPNSSWPPNRLCSASMRPCAAFSSKACPRSRSPLASAIPQEPSASSVISFAMISASAPASFRRFAGGLKRRPPAIGCGNGPSPCASETSRSTISNASWPPPAIPSADAPTCASWEPGLSRSKPPACKRKALPSGSVLFHYRPRQRASRNLWTNHYRQLPAAAAKKASSVSRSGSKDATERDLWLRQCGLVPRICRSSRRGATLRPVLCTQALAVSLMAELVFDSHVDRRVLGGESVNRLNQTGACGFITLRIRRHPQKCWARSASRPASAWHKHHLDLRALDSLITSCAVLPGKSWTDVGSVPETLLRRSPAPDVYPRWNSVTIERRTGAFTDQAILRRAPSEGIVDARLLCPTALLAIDDMVSSSWIYKQLRRFRAGIEGCISWAKRVFGLDQLHLDRLGLTGREVLVAEYQRGSSQKDAGPEISLDVSETGSRSS